MSLIDRLAWLSVTGWLARYSRRDKRIRHCFIRHSTAFEPQNVLVSDYDLAFFVDAGDFDEVRSHFIRIRHDLKKALVLDAIVLPASDAAYRLCASHYAHRSLYPMRNWRRLHGEPLTIPEIPYHPPPLDHSPEGFLYGYLVPVILGRTSRHRFESTLMRRKLEREDVQYNGILRKRQPMGFYEVAADQIRSWDRFYAGIEFSPPGERVLVSPIRSSSCDALLDRWMSTGARHKGLRAVTSLWVYPATNTDLTPHVSLNFEPSVSPTDLETSLAILLRTFRGLDYSLLLGTERSMLGRLGALNRVSLLEPWLCKASGRCLYGNSELGDFIREPSPNEVKEKLRELFLYLSYRVFPMASCPYPLYRLCFTADHLLKRHELVLNNEELADLYGRDFLRESEYEGSDGRQRTLDAWRQLHGLELFA